MSSLIIAGDISGTITLQAPAVAGTTVYNLPAESGALNTYQYYRLNSDIVGVDSTAVQSLLGVGVTLQASTQYEFELCVIQSKTAGTVSHTTSLIFGGTATLNNIAFSGYGSNTSTAFPHTPSGQAQVQSSISSTATLKSATTTAAIYLFSIIRGTVSINTGGTFIPQYQLSAAPGGAYTTLAGSYLRITPLGAAGSNINIGTWA